MAKTQLHGKTPSDEKNSTTGKNQKPVIQESQAETPTLQDTVNAVHQSSPQSFQMLQRTVGNRAVQGLVEKKPDKSNESTVIQRHVGSFADPTAIATDSLLTAGADSAASSLGAVQSAQSMFQSFRTMAASTPIPTQETGSPERRSEGHGYEFDDDTVE